MLRLALGICELLFHILFLLLSILAHYLHSFLLFSSSLFSLISTNLAFSPFRSGKENRQYRQMKRSKECAVHGWILVYFRLWKRFPPIYLDCSFAGVVLAESMNGAVEEWQMVVLQRIISHWCSTRTSLTSRFFLFPFLFLFHLLLYLPCFPTTRRGFLCDAFVKIEFPACFSGPSCFW